MKKSGLLDNLLLLPFGVLAWALEHWIITLLILFALPWGLDQVTEDHLALKRNTHGMGVCETLSEDAEVMLLFVNDRESSWTTEQIQSFLSNQVDPALAYIQEQAAAYGHNISLSRSYYTQDGMPYGIPCDADVTLATGFVQRLLQPDYLRKIAWELGYYTKNGMLQDDREYCGKKQVAYLICVNKSDRCYANSQETEILLYDSPEHAVIFSQDVYGGPTGSGTVAHELMHLFGADDYYNEGRRNKTRAELALQLCPNDIMFSGIGDTSLWTAGRYTAYTLGWLEDMPPEYDQWGWWF